MTPEQQEAAFLLTRKEISPADFLSLFGSSNGQELARNLLADAIRRKDGKDAEWALTVNYVFGFSIESMADLLELLSASWHSRHEDVVTALGRFRSEDTVYALFFATQWVPESLEFDDARALATKAVWALGAVPGERATNLLKVLAESEGNEIVRKGAVNQLKRRQAGN
jgi:hypothetical protein